jgi:hypothetical protein
VDVERGALGDDERPPAADRDDDDVIGLVGLGRQDVRGHRCRTWMRMVRSSMRPPSVVILHVTS